MNDPDGRRELVRVCRMLYERGLTVSAGGNMSLRLNDGTFLITPSGKNKGLLTEKEIVRIDKDGTPFGGGTPSIERFLHLALYDSNPSVNAVVHCHPLYCTALAVREEKVDCSLTPEGIILLGEVPMVEYHTPGSAELVEAVRERHSHMAMTMARHGALTQGRDLIEAYNRMEELEFQAHLQILTRGAEGLPGAEISKIRGGAP
ncbi:MAG: class II aldolase/adducin family protein [Candidatus Methanomethylophilaceae archaeon]|jgi:L-fuculose-phosphate aldolase|nr:ribulose phosphate epimerase [Methanomassiliicoccales archaeon RumEn M2]MDD2532631.1 class II aldolase/adducin family protein [Candidatus Methanomethylophilaceae archaeon]MDI9378136.1 class II aldolase/adducin family protein [Candidatus Thermoplasmatota archaeon]MDD2778740.1 class II aldolase/adducin family protein [Candidatus Methanomethylophilaceae archaeon]MDD3128634.1 class II aldolase/adducin family protein [Candidatus Methanomethylophilaceae archaeon]